MAYRINGGYKPFTFQELATPYMLYKDAYDKQEQNLEDLYDKASAYSDLDDLPEDSKARKIYDNYMESLNKANQDFASNGLTMNNRGLYNDIRRRYQGEIGKLARANEKVNKINAMRNAQSLQDPSMIYTQDNISIDDYLGNNKPNMFGISGRYLYDLGSKAGATSSSRIWSNAEVKDTANKFFVMASQTNGYTPEMLAKMRDDFMAIPEFRKEVENAMKANGVTKNLTGDKYTQAALNYVNGFVDSCTFKRNDNIMQNPEIEYNEKVREYNQNFAFEKQKQDDELATQGYYRGKDGALHYDMTKDPQIEKAKAIAAAKAAAKAASGGSNGNSNTTTGSKNENVMLPTFGISLTVKKKGEVTAEKIDKDVNGNYDAPGYIATYDEATKNKAVKARIDAYIGNNNPYNFRYFIEKDGSDINITAIPAEKAIKQQDDSEEMQELLEQLKQ